MQSVNLVHSGSPLSQLRYVMELGKWYPLYELYPDVVWSFHKCVIWKDCIHKGHLQASVTDSNMPETHLFTFVMKGIGGNTIFIIFPQYCTKYRVSRSHDYTQTLLSMLSKNEVCTVHAKCAKLLHFRPKPYKNPTQGASFHRVTC